MTSRMKQSRTYTVVVTQISVLFTINIHVARYFHVLYSVVYLGCGERCSPEQRRGGEIRLLHPSCSTDKVHR
jgi:hypothetical protein